MKYPEKNGRQHRWIVHSVALEPAGRTLRFWITAALSGLLAFLYCSQAFSASFSGRIESSAQTQNVHYSAQSKNAKDYGNSRAEQTQTVKISRQDIRALTVEMNKAGWRMRIIEAAVINNDIVTVGDIAWPLDGMPESVWQRVSGVELWLAPQEEGRPVNYTRAKLQQAMQAGMGREFAALFFYPPSTIMQRGGKLIGSDELQQIVVKQLTPMLASLPGESNFTDFRLPVNVFLSDARQSFELELPQRLSPGRLGLRFVVREQDGSIVRRLTGTVMLESWALVPCMTTVKGKGDTLTPGEIKFVRKNLALLREEPWDGRGGPWRLARSMSMEQPVLRSDLEYIPTVSKGNVVNLVYETQNLRLAVKAEIMADGATGETVLVRNLQSKKQVYATVRDANTVIVGRALRTAGNSQGGTIF